MDANNPNYITPTQSQGQWHSTQVRNNGEGIPCNNIDVYTCFMPPCPPRPFSIVRYLCYKLLPSHPFLLQQIMKVEYLFFLSEKLPPLPATLLHHLHMLLMVPSESCCASCVSFCSPYRQLSIRTLCIGFSTSFCQFSRPQRKPTAFLAAMKSVNPWVCLCTDLLVSYSPITIGVTFR